MWIFLAILLLAAALLWGGVVALLWRQQERLIFPGWGFKAVTASGLGGIGERITLGTADGVTLVGGLMRAQEPSRGLLLVFTGNAEDTDWRLRQLGPSLPHLDVVGFFYRGFGPSGGVPGEAALVADAVAIHDAMVERLRPPRVLAAGFSLGTGVAAQLAARRRLDGAVLLTPFDSVAAVAAGLYWFVPVRALLRHRFRSDEALRPLDLPVAVIGARKDQVVPPARTLALIEGLRRPVFVAWVEDADHVSIYSDPAYEAAWKAAIGRLLDSQPAGDPAPSGRPETGGRAGSVTSRAATSRPT